MERITLSHIEKALERLNDISKNKYVLYGAYGRIGVNKLLKGGGQSTLIYLTTKRECYAQIHAIIRWREFEKELDQGGDEYA